MKNRFFKALAEDGSTLDILIANDLDRARVMMLFRPWHHVFMSFNVVECSRKEWINWLHARRSFVEKMIGRK